MKFTIDRSEFINLLSDATKAIAPNTTIPVLQNIQLEIKNNQLTLTSSNSDLTIVQTYAGNDDHPLTNLTDGSFSMPGRFLLNVIKKMSGETVTVDNSKNAHRANVTSDRAHFHIPATDGSVYPHLPEISKPKEVVISAKNLLDTIKRVQFATSTEETRPILTAVNFVLDSTIKVNATDSHRLSLVQIKTSKIDNEIEKTSLNLPQVNLKQISTLLNKLPEDATVTFECEADDNSNVTKINFGNFQIISRQIVGNYPNVEQLVPQSSLTKLNIDRLEFLNALERAALTAHSMKELVVNLTLNAEKQEVSLASQTPDSANPSTDEKLLFNELTGESLKISFNPDYMIDALKAFSCDQLVLSFSGSLRLVLIENPEETNTFKHILTPVRTF